MVRATRDLDQAVPPVGAAVAGVDVAEIRPPLVSLLCRGRPPQLPHELEAAAFVRHLREEVRNPQGRRERESRRQLVEAVRDLVGQRRARVRNGA